MQDLPDQTRFPKQPPIEPGPVREQVLIVLADHGEQEGAVACDVPLAAHLGRQLPGIACHEHAQRQVCGQAGMGLALKYTRVAETPPRTRRACSPYTAARCRSPPDQRSRWLMRIPPARGRRARPPQWRRPRCRRHRLFAIEAGPVDDIRASTIGSSGNFDPRSRAVPRRSRQTRNVAPAGTTRNGAMNIAAQSETVIGCNGAAELGAQIRKMRATPSTGRSQRVPTRRAAGVRAIRSFQSRGTERASQPHRARGAVPAPRRRDRC
jgi:hypothetical protein